MAEKSTHEELKQRISELEKAAQEPFAWNTNKKYRVLFEKFKDAILVIKNEKIIDCNQAAIDMLGYKNKSEILQTHPSELSPDKQPDGKDSLTKEKEMLDLALKNGSNRFEWDHIRANGEIFPVEVLLTTISSQKGNQVLHTIWRDITHRKFAEKERQKEKETLSTILESTPHGITLINNQDEYLYVNPYFTKITGYTLKDIPTREDWFIKAYPDINYRKKVIQVWGSDCNQTGQEKSREFKITCKNGQSKHIEFKSTFIKDGKISVLTDVTQHRQAEKALNLLNLKLKYEATHDPLTGGLNRRAILDQLSKELNRAKRKNTNLSIGLCDIDHFKKVNDQHGHQVGDDVLCSFVKIIRNTLRPYDLVGRYGGEEFLLVIPDYSGLSKEKIYERVRAKIANHKIATRSGDVSITISIGITSSTGDETADEMLAAADAALYMAKKNGRNQLAFSDPAISIDIIKFYSSN